MNTHAKLAPEDQMTIEEFLAFTGTRPDEERWELIEGRPVMNASPVDFHQMIVGNIVALLIAHKSATKAPWYPIIGTGTRVPASANSLPQPDALVKANPLTGSSVTDDALVLFEVLSKSNSKADQAWRRRVYASVPNCQHYVTVSLKAAEVVAYDRSSAWKERRVKGTSSVLDLPALQASLPLADIYRWTPLGVA